MKIGSETKRLSEVSPLVRSLVEMKDVYWRWCVYAREDVREDVEAFPKKLLDQCLNTRSGEKYE